MLLVISNLSQLKYHSNVSFPKPTILKAFFLVFGKKWKAVPQNVVVSVGETIKIPCIPPDGFPEPTIEWFKGNNFLSLGKFSFYSSLLTSAINQGDSE